jgi:hypothetical protein
MSNGDNRDLETKNGTLHYQIDSIVVNGKLRCLVNGIEVDATVTRALLPVIAMQPISYAECFAKSFEEFKAMTPKTFQFTEAFSDAESGFLAMASHRYDLERLLVKRGRFTTEEAWTLLWGYPGDRLQIEQRASIWLLDELKKLPIKRGVRGAKSPVRELGLLSPLEIADLAIAMLDYNCPRDENDLAIAINKNPPLDEKSFPTRELIRLLGQLLGVTRHRETFATSDQYSHKFLLAAQIDGKAALQGKTVPVRELAKMVSRSNGTIVTWRRSARYKELVDFEKRRS